MHVTQKCTSESQNNVLDNGKKNQEEAQAQSQQSEFGDLGQVLSHLYLCHYPQEEAKYSGF
jgi:hypothetical protein